MEKSEIILYGREEIDTAGNRQFIMEGCPFCSVLTDGSHEWFCPNRKNKYNIVYINEESKSHEF
jgi:hypothetical protein